MAKVLTTTSNSTTVIVRPPEPDPVDIVAYNLGGGGNITVEGIEYIPIDGNIAYSAGTADTNMDWLPKNNTGSDPNRATLLGTVAHNGAGLTEFTLLNMTEVAYTIYLTLLEWEGGDKAYQVIFNGQSASSGETTTTTVGGAGDWKTLGPFVVPPLSDEIKIQITGDRSAVASVRYDAEDSYVVIPTTGLAIGANNAQLVRNEIYQIPYSVTPAHATNKAVNWSSSNNAVCTVTPNGEVTATASTIGTHTATVTGTTVDGGHVDTIDISVVITDDTVNVTGVSVSPAVTNIIVGGTKQLYTTVSPTDASDTSVTWSTSNGAVATVSAGGNVQAVAEGSATITATTNDGSFTSNCNVTVLGASSGTLYVHEPGTAVNNNITRWGKQLTGSIEVENNQWATNNRPEATATCWTAADGKHGWNWSMGPQINGYQQVAMYLQNYAGHKPWNEYSVGHGFPFKVTGPLAPTKFECTYDYTLTHSQGASDYMNQAFEFWTVENYPNHTTRLHEYGGSKNIKGEYMLWTHHRFGGLMNGARKWLNTTIDGRNYDIAAGPTDRSNPANSHMYFAFMPNFDYPSGTLDALAIIEWLRLHDVVETDGGGNETFRQAAIEDDHWICSMEMGNETINGSGSMSINNYRLEIVRPDNGFGTNGVRVGS